MFWIWLILGTVGLLVLLGLVMWQVGRRLPEEHNVSVTLRLRNATPEMVWDTIADVASYPGWSKINKVERLPDRNGHEVWREWMGRNSFVMETTRSERPRRLENTVEDDAKFFSGRWEYLIGPDPDPAAGGRGCIVMITEHGRVHHAIPRFMMHYLMDPRGTALGFLRALAKKLGEDGEIS